MGIKGKPGSPVSLRKPQNFPEKEGKTWEADASLTALEANRYKLLNLIRYMDNCPTEKGEEELKHPR